MNGLMTNFNEQQIKEPENKFDLLRRKIMKDSVMEPGFIDGLMSRNKPMEYANLSNTIGNRLRTMFVDPVINYVKSGAKGMRGEPLSRQDIQNVVEGNMDWGIGSSLGSGLMQGINPNVMHSIPINPLFKKVGGQHKKSINNIPILDHKTFSTVVNDNTLKPGEWIGLRGLHKKEIGKKELNNSYSTVDGFAVDELPGTSVIGTDDIDEIVDGLDFYIDSTKPYATSDYIGIVKGKDLGNDVELNDFGERLFTNTEVLGYIPIKGLK